SYSYANRRRYGGLTGKRDVSRAWLYSLHHAPTYPFSMERNARPSSGALAQPVSALAHGDLFRAQDGQNRLCGILGIHVPGTKTVKALLEMDSRHGELREAKAEKPLSFV